MWESHLADVLKLLGAIFAGLFGMWKLSLKSQADGVRLLKGPLGELAEALRENCIELRRIGTAADMAQERDKETRAAVERAHAEVKDARSSIERQVETIPCNYRPRTRASG